VAMDYSERARALLGTPFRLQGRGPDGMDCIGVAIATFGVPVEDVRRNYRVRGEHADELRTCVEKYFRRIPSTELRPGDLMLMRVAADLLHLGIRTAAGFVHAHAGLRRVVETPGMPPWPVTATYRRRRR
jgi:lipoprotein Spr